MTNRRTHSRRSLVALVLMLAVVASVLPVVPLAPTALAQAISEVEPNDTPATAQNLPRIGRENALQARINDDGDADWFSFEVVAGRTYVVELFSVSRSLGLERRFYTCDGQTSWHTGLALFVHDVVNSTQMKAVCNPNGSGNVFVQTSFKAESTGPVRLHIYAQNPQGQGNYQLRILPKFAEAGASWESATFEPNNLEANAALIQVGRENAITARIEARDPALATNSGDNDWYRFEAVQGRTYVVEIFNASQSFGQDRTFYTCNGQTTWHTGLALFARDTINNSQLSAACNPNAGGNVLVSIVFKAENTGFVTLLVYGQHPDESGQYSLRVLPHYDEEGASWDLVTFEPNNRSENAFALPLDAGNSLRGAIEQRDSIFATHTGDVDWYRFQAVRGQRYTVQLTEISTSLSQGRSFYACAGRTTWHTGLALLAYDTTTGGLIAAQCSSSDDNRVVSIIQFDAPSTGVITLLIYPNDANTFGSYSLRVCDGLCTSRTFLPFVRR